MYELEITALQRLLLAEVGETFRILDLRDTNGSTAYERQLVGTHVSQHAGHIAKLVGVLHACPLVATIGQIFVVVMTYIVAGVKKVFKVIKTDCIN